MRSTSGRALTTYGGDILQLYLIVSESELSSALIREKEMVQKPVYYGSRVMRRAETRYSLTEKMVYALIIVARKLKPYFDAHPLEEEGMNVVEEMHGGHVWKPYQWKSPDKEDPKVGDILAFCS
ncbi:hypothetical protein LIER_27824 [Lithospermum erythrorhizon]|uniref:Reverse transcriptase RNase H-like domain-containing protein n=1 Tax=Lithospermum erythrorhizon TaxID=34254 RepID=A0AAV3RDE8_LITER